MPSTTPKQRRVMSAISHGWHPTHGSVAKIPLKVAKEFHAADKGHKYGKGMHSKKKADGGKIEAALRTARKYAEGGKARKSPFVHEMPGAVLSPNVEDRRGEWQDRFHDTVYFPEGPQRSTGQGGTPGYVQQPYLANNGPMAADLGEQNLVIGPQPPTGYADGGDVEDDNTPDPFASEKFVAPPVQDWVKQAAPKDLAIIQGVGNLAAHTWNLPQQMMEGSAHDVEHLGEQGYEPQSVAPATEAAMDVMGATFAGAAPKIGRTAGTTLGMGWTTEGSKNMSQIHDTVLGASSFPAEMHPAAGAISKQLKSYYNKDIAQSAYYLGISPEDINTNLKSYMSSGAQKGFDEHYAKLIKKAPKAQQVPITETPSAESWQPTSATEVPDVNVWQDKEWEKNFHEQAKKDFVEQHGETYNPGDDVNMFGEPHTGGPGGAPSQEELYGANPEAPQPLNANEPYVAKFTQNLYDKFADQGGPWKNIAFHKDAKNWVNTIDENTSTSRIVQALAQQHAGDMPFSPYGLQGQALQKVLSDQSPPGFLRAMSDFHLNPTELTNILSHFPADKLAEFEEFIRPPKPAPAQSADVLPEDQRQAARLKGNYVTEAFQGMRTKPGGSDIRPDFNTETRYSTASTKLADMYAGYLQKHPGDAPKDSDYYNDFKTGSVMPLWINTKDYKVIDAKGQSRGMFDTHDGEIGKARYAGAPGVVLKNVIDEPHIGSNTLGPQQVFLTFPAGKSTVKSKFAAQFDPTNKDINRGIAAIGMTGAAAGAGMAMAPQDAEAGPLDQFMRGIRGYHWSPADFDKFNMERIGTGESSVTKHGLMFGHGLYFSENPAVAEAYRRKYSQLLQPGRMYEVNVGAQAQDFLHWDAQLSQQANIASKLQNVDRFITPDLTGEQAYRHLEQQLQMNPKEIANSLRENDIPGIRYLDLRSRNGQANPQTHNITVLDDNMITIMRKYGIPVGMTGVAVAMAAKNPYPPGSEENSWFEDQRPKAKAEGGAVGDDYNTVLSPEDEANFQVWKQQNMPNDSGVDYDQRGAYMAQFQQQANGHWQDQFKKPNHPTFSDQSQYAVGDQRNRAGYWNDDQFIPPAPLEKGGKVKHKQIDEDPQEHEFIDFSKGGLIDSDIPGRTDKIPMKVPPGSFVLPADIPSALGQGNTKAGADVLKKMFTSGPYGLPPPKGVGHAFSFPHHFSMSQPLQPHQPSKQAQGGKVEGKKSKTKVAYREADNPARRCGTCKYAYGPTGQRHCQLVEGMIKPDDVCNLWEGKTAKKAEGGPTDHVPIITAGGEFIIHPDVVKHLGEGNIKQGHKLLTKFVNHTRKQHIKTLKGLKPPK